MEKIKDFRNAKVESEPKLPDISAAAPAEPLALGPGTPLAKIKHKVVKVHTGEAQEVRAFEFRALHEDGHGLYETTRKKFGPLASTDSDRRHGKSVKDSRFELSTLARDPLAINQEEDRVIQARVDSILKTVCGEAQAQAMRLGFDEGEKKGYQEAFQKFQADCASMMENLDRLLGEFEGMREQIYRANERILMDMVYGVAKMLALKEIQADPGYVGRLASSIIEKIGTRDHIRISVSPSDLLTLKNIKTDLETRLGSLKNLSVEPSSQVVLGGCLIETEFNAIDASVESQLEAVREALLGAGVGSVEPGAPKA